MAISSSGRSRRSCFISERATHLAPDRRSRAGSGPTRSSSPSPIAVSEAHDTPSPARHGPILRGPEAGGEEAAKEFREERIPKFLGWFEAVLTRNPEGSDHLVGNGLTYADLSLFQVVEGLDYAFPKATERALEEAPSVVALHDMVAERPRIAAYLDSDRRLPFSEEGIFRRYAELDV